MNIHHPDYLEQIRKIQEFAENEIQDLIKKDFPIVLQMDQTNYRVNNDLLTVYPTHVILKDMRNDDTLRFNFKKIAFFYSLARTQNKMEDCADLRSLDTSLMLALNDSKLFSIRFKQFLQKGDSFKCQLYINRLQESKLMLNILSNRVKKYTKLAKYQKGPKYEIARF